MNTPDVVEYCTQLVRRAQLEREYREREGSITCRSDDTTRLLIMVRNLVAYGLLTCRYPNITRLQGLQCIPRILRLSG